KEGFVLAPFFANEDNPLLLMHADIHVCMDINKDSEAYTPLKICEESDEKNHYHLDFANFHAQICEGQFQKLVLSRQLKLFADQPIPVRDLFLRACRRYPHQFVALVSMQRAGTWLMATPELLLSGKAGQWQTMALAGTRRANGDSAEKSPLTISQWTKKDLMEQRYVTTYITEILEHYANDITVKGPYTSMAAQLLHLRTDFHFTLNEKQRIGSLLSDLFPTPAVCGLPKDTALKFILDNEYINRRYYSGFCGVLQPEGTTNLYVSLRCMEIDVNHCTLYAGGGLLRESQEEKEWQETEAKLQTMKVLL
ncbi:MAG: isochorismate synthase, partial [Prevotella sp.]